MQRLDYPGATTEQMSLETLLGRFKKHYGGKSMMAVLLHAKAHRSGLLRQADALFFWSVTEHHSQN